MKDILRVCITIFIILNIQISISLPANEDYFNLASKVPRISYKLKKDSGSKFWIINLDFNQETKQLPMMIIPYTKESWFSTRDYPEKNIKALICDLSTECNIFGSQENEDTMSFFNYSIKGRAANLRPDPDSYSSFFNITSLSETIKPEELPQINPPMTIMGGLGFGWDHVPDGTSFFHSFVNLDNYVAGIYLSINEFDVTSELMIGDYNDAFAENIKRNYTIPVKNETRWSIGLNTDSSITDNNGNNYFTKGMNEIIFDPNLDFIGIPDIIYQEFFTNFTQFNNLSCSSGEKAFPVCECDETKLFPTIYFHFSNQNVAFPPKLYVERGAKCTLLIGSTKFRNVGKELENVWVFGSPVMIYYYTIFNFNYPNFQIILTKTKPLEDKTKWYLIVGIIAIFVCGTGFVAWFIICRNKKSLTKSEALSNQDEGKNEEKLLSVESK